MSSKTLAMKLFAVLGHATLVFLVGCGGNTSQPPPPSQPMAVTVSPSSATVETGGVQQFTATVSPSGANQAVTWSLSGTGCTGASCGTIDAAGKYTAPASVPNPPTVTVRAASVADSAKAAVAAVNIMTTVNNPIPTISVLSPSVTTAGEPAFTLTVVGLNFVSSSVVGWNGSDRPTAFISASQVSAQIPASDIAAAGTAAITVFNPAPGGGASNSLTFTITTDNPTPTIAALSRSSTVVGGPAFTLTVNGSGFVSKSVVRWNGSDRTTAFVSSSQVTAQILASDIAATGTAAVTVFNPAPGGGSSNSLAFTIGVFVARFAYVANSGSNDVSMYTINATTGALAPIGTIAAELSPSAVAVDPSGKFAYVVNQNSDNISMYAINATTGALTAIAPGTIAAGSNPVSVAVDPSGRFAYVTNSGFFAGEGADVSMYTISATTGALTAIGSINAVMVPVSVAVDSSGRFAYVAGLDPSSGPGIVAMYTINATTGALTAIGTIATGARPVSVAVDPSDRFAYVANEFSNDVSMYTIDVTTGALTSIGTIAAGARPVSVAVDPSDRFAYVANLNSNDVSMYTINATTGALTSIGTIAAGGGPVSVAVDPSGRFAYVANEGSSPSSGNVSMYTINATTGALTSIGTIAAGTLPRSVAIAGIIQ